MTEFDIMKRREYLDTLEKACKEYVDMCNSREKHYTQKQLTAAKKVASEARDAYNSLVAEQTYEQWNSMGRQGLIDAIKERNIPDMKKESFKANKAGTMGFKISPTDIKFDLYDFVASVGFKNIEEKRAFTKLNQLFYENIDSEVSNKMDQSCEVREKLEQEVREKFALSPDADVHSTVSGAKIMQKIVDSILFIPMVGSDLNKIKVEKKYYAALRESITSKGKACGQVNLLGARTLMELIIDQVHLLLNDKNVSLERAENDIVFLESDEDNEDDEVEEAQPE